MSQLGLIKPPTSATPIDAPMPGVPRLNSTQVKQALRGRHSASPAPMPGEWTCVEELWGVDLLAWSAWNSSRHRRVGYEVKVSRSDYRRELLKPAKRAPAKAILHQLYMAVPAGLLTAVELAYVEPIWDQGAFERKKCPARCLKASRSTYQTDRYAPRRGTVARDQVPVPAVLVDPYPERLDRGEEWVQRMAERAGRTVCEWIADQRDDSVKHMLRVQGWTYRACPECGGKGYVKGARVEEEAPTLWVPADVGLVEVHLGPRGGVTTREVKRAPILTPRSLTDREIAEAFRWASLRGDPRHRQGAEQRTEAAA